VRDVSAAELLTTRVCEFPGCEEDADVGSWCFYHARHAAPEAPPVAAPDPEPLDEPAETNGGTAVRPKTKPWTREEAIEALQTYHERKGRAPSFEELKAKNGLPGYPTLQKLFGGLPQARVAAGISNGPPPAEKTGPAEARVTTAGRRREASADSEPAPAALGSAAPSRADGVSEASSLVELAQAVEQARKDLAGARAQLEIAETKLERTVTELREALDSPFDRPTFPPPESETP